VHKSNREVSFERGHDMFQFGAVHLFTDSSFLSMIEWHHGTF
jgi:hypothetical protein